MAPPLPDLLKSRIRGAVLGLAVCDALGGPVEFQPRGSFPLVTEMLPNGNFNLPAGAFTDDTSMALCLAHSLIDCNGSHNAVDQVEKYLDWRSNGYMSSVGYCFDIGVSTSGCLAWWKALLREAEKERGPPRQQPLSEAAISSIQQQIYRTYNLEKFCGNGSLMRVLPVALIASAWPSNPNQHLLNQSQIPTSNPNLNAVAQLAIDSSLTTHPHPRCTAACSLYSQLVYLILTTPTAAASASAEAIDSNDSATATTTTTTTTTTTIMQQFLADSLRQMLLFSDGQNASTVTSDRTIDTVLKSRLLQPYASLDDWKRKPASEIRSTGYVVDSLEAALWAFFSSNTFEDGAIKVVNLGDDADTVGAIYGGLAGAFYGAEAIPTRWLEKMLRVDLLDEVVEGIIQYHQREKEKGKEEGKEEEDK